jgi:hypothetical protein
VRADVGSCSSETLALDVGADRITAIAVDGPDVFWADLYSTPITGSRVHLVRPGIPERLLLELDGEVTSIVLDARNMYVALRHVGTTRRTLVRMRRP